MESYSKSHRKTTLSLPRWHKGSFVFKHLCQYCIVLDTHKGVMTSNDVKGECHITMMTGMCVNKPDQIEPVGCYENTFISKFAKCM